MNGTEELGLKDVTFLRAIRDINGSPERYASTEQGVTPATVTAITEATTLSEEEVASRLDNLRLGKSGLVTVYEAGPPGDDSASLDSAELTEAGERAITEAEDRDRSGDEEEWAPDEGGSEFDEIQEWEPADVENGSDAARAEGATTDAMAATPTESTEHASTSENVTARTNEQAAASTTADESGDDDRIAALEERIERLEAESRGEGNEQSTADDERVDDLAAEVAALRETTERLKSTLSEALDDLDAIRKSEYGALDEKREQQFETAVKSMVAFHQLATEVLDVRVENYEPSAGHADRERVEITRNRIGDALGVGQGSDSGRTLEMGDDEWPDPEEAARGGRVLSDDEPTAAEADEPEDGSDAPDSGVYPPIGGDDESTGTEDDGEPESTDVEGSNAPESGVYPPIGDDAADEGPGGDGSLPESMRPEADAAEGSITETAAEEGHVVDPIRSTGGVNEPDLPLGIDHERALDIRRAVVDTRDGADDEVDADTTDGAADPWLLAGVDSADARAVRDAVQGSNEPADDPAFPEGEAYARIVDEPSGD